MTKWIPLLLLVAASTASCRGGRPTPDCRHSECVRIVICHRGNCSGPVTQRSCCACPPGDVDEIECVPPAR